MHFITFLLFVLPFFGSCIVLPEILETKVNYFERYIEEKDAEDLNLGDQALNFIPDSQTVRHVHFCRPHFGCFCLPYTTRKEIKIGPFFQKISIEGQGQNVNMFWPRLTGFFSRGQKNWVARAKTISGFGPDYR